MRHAGALEDEEEEIFLRIRTPASYNVPPRIAPNLPRTRTLWIYSGLWKYYHYYIYIKKRRAAAVGRSVKLKSQ